jgi:hypothetical protein
LFLRVSRKLSLPLNKISFQFALDKNMELCLGTFVDGQTIKEGWHTNPYDMLDIVTMEPIYQCEEEAYPNYINFGNCSCGVPGCGGFGEYEFDVSGDSVHIRARGYTFSRTEIINELESVVLEMLNLSPAPVGIAWYTDIEVYMGEKEINVTEELNSLLNEIREVKGKLNG